MIADVDQSPNQSPNQSPDQSPVEWSGAGPLRIIERRHGDPEFRQCLAIRWHVFVIEQKVPVADERDGLDAEARHFLAFLDGQAVGTARVIRRDGGAIAKVGRVEILASARGRGLGSYLMRHLEVAVAADRFVLAAQTRAIPFYRRLGYESVGDIFWEAGIPHRQMQKITGPSSPPGSEGQDRMVK